MNIVITMGGLGSRFRKAGYTVPKYQIEAKGRTLFSWSMLSLQAFWKERFIFLVRSEDQAEKFIRHECDCLGITDVHIVELSKLTRGQAETAMQAAPVWRAEDPMLIYNIDTYVDAGEMHQEMFHGDGCIPCFTAEGTHWSFVRLDDFGKVTEVREKERISNHCSLGAYYFGSGTLYAELYDSFYFKKRILEHGEQYIAPMYNLLLARGGNVYMQDIPSEHVHVLGTPTELMRFEYEDK